MTKSGGASRLLKRLRSLRVLIVHPNDQDGQELISQLQRIGCQVKAFWPPSEEFSDEFDLAFLAVRPEVLSMSIPWLRDDACRPLIAVVTYENPTIVEAVLNLSARAVIASPVKSFGLLTSIVVALHGAESQKAHEHYTQRIEQRIATMRKVAKAKAVLMQTQNISEQEAYQVIRNQAMSKRVTTEEIADAVIKANEILTFDAKTARR